MTDYPSLTVLGNKVLEPRKELECFPNPAPGKLFQVKLECNEFTCLCPVTGQPDFATIALQYIPKDKIVESKSFKLYLWSFRNEKGFHEKIINDIADYFFETVRPLQVTIQGNFNPRGGIGIIVEAMRKLEPKLPGPGQQIIQPNVVVPVTRRRR